MKHSTPMNELVRRLRSSVPDGDTYIHHRAIVARLSQLADGVSHLENLARTQDPMETPARHAQRVAEAAGKLKGKATSLDDVIANTVRDATRILDERITERAGLREDSYASEIRASVRSLPQDKRDEVLREAVARGQGNVVAAMTTGPEVLTGFSGDLQERMRDQFRRQHAPNEYKAMDDLHAVFSSSAVAIGLAKKAAGEAVNPEYIAEIRTAQESAKQAQAAFDSALST